MERRARLLSWSHEIDWKMLVGDWHRRRNLSGHDKCFITQHSVRSQPSSSDTIELTLRGGIVKQA